MEREQLKNTIFVGIIEDNKDPEKRGRCRVRVSDIFDNIPVEDIPWAKPWKDSNGNLFSVPEVGKVVSVVFDRGSIYRPEFIYAEHYNFNLESKLLEISEDDYVSFKALMFDHSTQIYRSKSKGLVLDHEYTNINLDPKGHINFNLRNNGAKINLGTFDADQQAILGNHFFDWMDTLIDTLSGTPYMGNLMAPVFPGPTLIPVLTEYRTARATSKFLSTNVFIVDNEKINTQKRDYVNQEGDNWKSTVTKNELTKRLPSEPNKEPQPAADTNQPQQEQTQPQQEQTKQEVVKEENYSGFTITPDVPPSHKQLEIKNEGRKDAMQSSRMAIPGEKNGEVSISKLALCPRIKADVPLGANSSDEDQRLNWYLVPNFAKAWNDLMILHDKSDYPGKPIKDPKVLTTQGYRTLKRQNDCWQGGKNTKAAKPGTSNHGWGGAVDVFWGVTTDAMKMGKNWMGAIYRHPTYQWFFNNSYKFGVYNPLWARDGVGNKDEWWHWEYWPWLKNKPPSPLIDEYSGPFTLEDWQTLYSMNTCRVGYMEQTIKKYKQILLYDLKGNYLYDAKGNFIGQHLFDKDGNYIELEERKKINAARREEERKRAEEKKLKKAEEQKNKTVNKSKTKGKNKK